MSQFFRDTLWHLVTFPVKSGYFFRLLPVTNSVSGYFRLPFPVTSGYQSNFRLPPVTFSGYIRLPIMFPVTGLGDSRWKMIRVVTKFLWTNCQFSWLNDFVIEASSCARGGLRKALLVCNISAIPQGSAFGAGDSRATLLTGLVFQRGKHTIAVSFTELEGGWGKRRWFIGCLYASAGTSESLYGWIGRESQHQIDYSVPWSELCHCDGHKAHRLGMQHRLECMLQICSISRRERVN